MITISGNSTPMTWIQGNGSSVQLQEARASGFSFLKTIVICDTGMIGVNVGVLLNKKDDPELKLNILIIWL